MSSKTKSVLLRFTKGFVAGGIGSILPLIQASSVDQILNNPSLMLYTLIMAFITGGLLAIEKMLRWNDAQER